jgi:hypothetical protein
MLLSHTPSSTLTTEWRVDNRSSGGVNRQKDDGDGDGDGAEGEEVVERFAPNPIGRRSGANKFRR